MPPQPRLEPRKQPRQVRAELTRERILDSAAHVFAEHGYAAGTTNRIAAHARVSIGSLYQYYPSKDAILLELLTRHLAADPVLTMLDNADPEGDLETFVRAMVHGMIGNHQEDPHLLRLMIEQAPQAADLLEQVATVERQMVERLGAILREHPQVRVADLETAARLVVATVELTVHYLIAAPNSMDADRLENEMVAMLTAYLIG